MLKIAREFLEQSDLEQLHLQFDESKEDWVEQNEIELPMFDSCKKEDLWTEAIEAVSTQNVAKMRNVYTKIMHSDMSLEGKAWWESILTIGMNPPLEELERVMQKNRRTATPTTSNVIYKVAGQFAQDALVQEQKMRTQKDIEDREKLVQLQQEAVRRQQQKEIAEENLRKHRQS